MFTNGNDAEDCNTLQTPLMNDDQGTLVNDKQAVNQDEYVLAYRFVKDQS